MSDGNIISIIGRVTRDPELRYTQGGTAVLNIDIANNRHQKKDEEWKTKVCYVQVIVWAKYGETLAEKIKKGYLLNVDGRLDQDTWEDADGKNRSKHFIVASSVQVLKKPSESGSQSSEQSQDKNDNPFSDDDIPF